MNTFTGDITPISPPNNVRKGKKEKNSTIFFFEERENVRLSISVPVDISSPGYYQNNRRPGTISAGTLVNSYFLHFDRKGSTPDPSRAEGYVTFDEEILGVIMDKPNHRATNAILGNPGTTYANEKGKVETNNTDSITWSGNTLHVRLKSTYGLDQIRVITEHCVPPTLTSLLLNGRNSNITISEGNSVSARLEATDPNRNSTISFFLDGRNIGTNSGVSGTRSISKNLGVFPDNGTFTYRAQAKDEDGKYSSTIIRTVTVNNVAPTLTGFNLSSNLINEGQSASAFLYATDPGADSISFYLDGSFISTDFRTSSTRSASKSLGTFQDNGVFRFSARARDDDNAFSNTRTQTLTVNNVAPTLTDFNLSRKVINEGESVSVQMSATDPGADGISFYLDGSFISTDTRRSGTRQASKSLDPFQDDGIFTFTHSAQAQDDDGAFSNVIRKTQTVTVNNVAPTLDFNLSRNVINEGESVEALMSATDPGADTISFYLDDNLISTDDRTSGTREASTDLGTFQNDGTFTFSARSQDSDGADSDTITRTLTVKNVAPTITSLTEDLIVRIDKTFSFEATATDLGLDDILVYEWDLDADGQYDDFTGSSGEWSFSEPGDHEVKLRVSDGDGGFDYDSFTVTAEENIVKPYSFRFTDIKAVSDDPEGNEFQFSFEIINWSDRPAAGIEIAIHEDTNQVQIDDPPEFAGGTVDSNRDPITGNMNLPNNSTVSDSNNTSIKWNLGDPLLNRDVLGPATNAEACQLIPGCDLLSGEPHVSDIEAIDDGDNVRDGFVFNVDNWDEGEILILNWFLKDENGDNIGTADAGNKNGSGIVQFYRSALVENNNPDALFGVPDFIQPSELFYNNVNRVTEFA